MHWLECHENNKYKEIGTEKKHSLKNEKSAPVNTDIKNSINIKTSKLFISGVN